PRAGFRMIRPGWRMVELGCVFAGSPTGAGPGVGPVSVFRLRNTAHPRSAHPSGRAPASRPGHVRARVGERTDARLLVGEPPVISARDVAVWRRAGRVEGL